MHTKGTCIVLSPHLDDAVFSAGSYIETLSQTGYHITIITLFSAVDTKEPETKFAKKFVEASGHQNAHDLFEARKREDRAAWDVLGIDDVKYGNFVDAAWRTKNHLHLYPTSSAVFGGEINSQDEIASSITTYVHSFIKPVQLVIGPQGIGNHVDHIITHQIAQSLPAEKHLFWADQPYVQYCPFKNSATQQVKPSIHKRAAVQKYASQMSSIVTQKPIDEVNELLY